MPPTRCAQEYPKRFALWLRNMEHVAEHAAKQSTMQVCRR